MEKIKVKLGFEGLFTIEPIGRGGGGLAVLWKENNLLKIQNYSMWHIDAFIKNTEAKIPWRLTGFYGQPDWTKRKES
jgi:hypothetical protein